MGTRLTIETRVLATDPTTQRAFAAYWFFIRASSGAIRREVLRVVAPPVEFGSAQRSREPAPSATVRACAVLIGLRPDRVCWYGDPGVVPTVVPRGIPSVQPGGISPSCIIISATSGCELNSTIRPLCTRAK